MPVVSMFYGIIISMYFYDKKEHHRPHIHVRYQEDEAIIFIPEGEVVRGKIPPHRFKLVLAWIEIHREELMANWALAIKGKEIFKIDPLK